ncbi:DUF2914 domain-containing protein [Candidatus Kaiserbacteria bacterium]|nr:DUF2914 domain-containing protein [Candidatus Kaiserbacteria bacterium]
MVLRFYKVTKEKMVHVRKHWLTIAFLLGFVIDNITLNRVDQVFDNVILFTYVVLAMASLLALYAGTANRFGEATSQRLRMYAPLVVQYAFGGLLSGMLIFYSRSGTLYTSWPFLLLILVVIFGNETIRDRARRLVFNLAVLFVGLFSYLVLVIPVLTGKMGAWVFVGSGLLALFIMYWFFRLLIRIVPNYIMFQMRSIVFTIGIIFASLNFLYFSNLIPPIPLSLKDIGMFHNVERLEDGSYELTYEKTHWWEFFRDSDTHFNYGEGDSVYCYASVFAPARLATDVYHRWEKYDEESQTWVEHDRLSYSIAGGRDGGYRGYTAINAYSEGLWRCTVETPRGQVIGRETFEIEHKTPRGFETRIDSE